MAAGRMSRPKSWRGSEVGSLVVLDEKLKGIRNPLREICVEARSAVACVIAVCRAHDDEISTMTLDDEDEDEFEERGGLETGSRQALNELRRTIRDIEVLVAACADEPVRTRLVSDTSSGLLIAGVIELEGSVGPVCSDSFASRELRQDFRTARTELGHILAGMNVVMPGDDLKRALDDSDLDAAISIFVDEGTATDEATARHQLSDLLPSRRRSRVFAHLDELISTPPAVPSPASTPLQQQRHHHHRRRSSNCDDGLPPPPLRETESIAARTLADCESIDQNIALVAKLFQKSPSTSSIRSTSVHRSMASLFPPSDDGDDDDDDVKQDDDDDEMSPNPSIISLNIVVPGPDEDNTTEAAAPESPPPPPPPEQERRAISMPANRDERQHKRKDALGLPETPKHDPTLRELRDLIKDWRKDKEEELRDLVDDWHTGRESFSERGHGTPVVSVTRKTSQRFDQRPRSARKSNSRTPRRASVRSYLASIGATAAAAVGRRRKSPPPQTPSEVPYDRVHKSAEEPIPHSRKWGTNRRTRRSSSAV